MTVLGIIKYYTICNLKSDYIIKRKFINFPSARNLSGRTCDGRLSEIGSPSAGENGWDFFLFFGKMVLGYISIQRTGVMGQVTENDTT